MKKKILLIPLAFLLAMSLVATACAAPAPPVPAPAPEVVLEGALEKIDRTGTFVVGEREDAIPFGFFDEEGNWVGFSIDLIKEIHKKVEEVLGKDIKLEFMPITAKTRIPLLTAGTIDMGSCFCTHTRPRDEVVDYSILVFIGGIQMLVPKASPIRDWEDIAGKRVGTVSGTVGEGALLDLNQHLSPPIDIKTFEKHTIGFLALREGKTEVHITDGIALAGLMAKSPDPENWEVRGGFLVYSPLAFIVRENDSDFRDLVNHTLIEAIEDGRFMEIYDRWLGPEGVIPFPMGEDVKAYFQLICWPK